MALVLNPDTPLEIAAPVAGLLLSPRASARRHVADRGARAYARCVSSISSAVRPSSSVSGRGGRTTTTTTRPCSNGAQPSSSSISQRWMRAHADRRRRTTRRAAAPGSGARHPGSRRAGPRPSSSTLSSPSSLARPSVGRARSRRRRNVDGLRRPRRGPPWSSGRRERSPARGMWGGRLIVSLRANHSPGRCRVHWVTRDLKSLFWLFCGLSAIHISRGRRSGRPDDHALAIAPLRLVGIGSVIRFCFPRGQAARRCRRCRRRRSS